MSQKKTKVKALRNVLATPFNIKWSESSSEGVVSLQKALEELLPLAKLEKKSLKLPTKDEMKEKIPPRNSSRKPHNNIFRSYLAPGFQSVIRGLEKGELSCVLMSTDISPPMIPRVVCSYCNARDIPLMTVPKLKTITKITLGFSTMVLGLKGVTLQCGCTTALTLSMVVKSQSVAAQPLSEIVVEVGVRFSWVSGRRDGCQGYGEDHQQGCTNHSADYSGKKCVAANENPFFPIHEIALQNRSSFETPFTAKKIEVDTPLKEEKPCITKGKSSKLSLKSKVVYLYRQNINERVFRPGKNNSEEKFLEMPKHGMDADFISLSNSEANEPSPTVEAIHASSKSEREESEEDSLDEDNLFFVDNQPDQSNNHSQTDVDMESIHLKSPQNHQPETSFKTKTKNERYFSSKVDQGEKLHKVNKKKEKKQKHNEMLQTGKTNGKSTKFNPLTIKTVISNPKKIRRKKKREN